MTSETLEVFLSTLRQCKQDYDIALATETECNQWTQDILHKLELNDLPYHEIAKLGRELQTVRRNRRRAMDAIELLGPVVTYVEGNSGTIKALERVLGEMRKVERRHENRMYTPRVRKEDKT